MRIGAGWPRDSTALTGSYFRVGKMCRWKERRGFWRWFMNNQSLHVLKSPIPSEPGAETGTEVPLLRVKQKTPSFGNTWESLGAGWLLPHPELIPCPSRLEFLLLEPICCDFITTDFKWVGFLLNQSPINYLGWALYKGPIFISFPAHVTDSLVMEIFAFRQPCLLLPIKARKTQRYCSPSPIFHFL